MHEIGPLHPRDLLAESGPKHRIVFLYIFSLTAHLWLDLIHSVKTRLYWEWLFRHLSCSHHSRTHHCIKWTRYKSKLAVWNTPSVKPGVQGSTTINLESLIFWLSSHETWRIVTIHLTRHTRSQITASGIQQLQGVDTRKIILLETISPVHPLNHPSFYRTNRTHSRASKPCVFTSSELQRPTDAC